MCLLCTQVGVHCCHGWPAAEAATVFFVEEELVVWLADSASALHAVPPS